MVSRKSRFGWVRFHIEISNVTGPNFTKLVSPNVGGIAVDQIFVRFWISLSVPEIFAAELRSRLKSGRILDVLTPKIFWSEPPESLDQHYKIQPSTNYRAKFRADRPTHFGDLMTEIKKKNKTFAVKLKSS